MAWMWLLWLLSQTWITIHIWTPKAERLASTEKLFVVPMYNGLLIDQSMALNRKRDDQKDVKTEVIILKYYYERRIVLLNFKVTSFMFFYFFPGPC